MTDEFDPKQISFRLGNLQFDARQALDRLLEASPWLTREILDEYDERVAPAQQSPRTVP
jgi:hypothetical protein